MDEHDFISRARHGLTILITVGRRVSVGILEGNEVDHETILIRSSMLWLELFTRYLCNEFLAQLWGPKLPRKPRDPNKVWHAMESL